MSYLSRIERGRSPRERFWMRCMLVWSCLCAVRRSDRQDRELVKKGMEALFNGEGEAVEHILSSAPDLCGSSEEPNECFAASGFCNVALRSDQ